MESQKAKFIERESKVVVTMAGGGENGEMSVKGYKLPIIRFTQD